jgi:hypothetical protein
MDERRYRARLKLTIFVNPSDNSILHILCYNRIMATRFRTADDFTTIYQRVEELRREQAKVTSGTVASQSSSTGSPPSRPRAADDAAEITAGIKKLRAARTNPGFVDPSMD